MPCRIQPPISSKASFTGPVDEIGRRATAPVRQYSDVVVNSRQTVLIEITMLAVHASRARTDIIGPQCAVSLRTPLKNLWAIARPSN